MASFEEAAATLDIKSIVITMILSALGFLVAFTWRDAISEAIDHFIPAGEGLIYTFYAAILVTIIAVIITYILIKIQKMDLIPDKYENKLKEKVRKKKQKVKPKVKGTLK